MTKQEKIWWEGIADQYEAWAEEPPQGPWCEYYTCSAFYDSYIWWGFYDMNDFEVVLKRLISMAGYADLGYPIGHLWDNNRATKREAFCQDMADTIRDYICD